VYGFTIDYIFTEKNKQFDLNVYYQTKKLKCTEKRENMKNDNNDRRTLRTREMIHEALLSLMLEKPYNKITVQHIIDRANIGRSTFYSHYETKDELLADSLEFMLEMLNNHLNHDISKGRIIPARELFEHIKEDSRFMKALVKAGSENLFFDKATSNWNKNISVYILSQIPEGKETAVPIPLLTGYICNTLIYLLRWWINDKMKVSPVHMEQYFLELVNPSIKSIISE